MKKFTKSVVLISSLLLFAGSLFAHGKDDIEELSVENLNSWQEQFDLDERKPGKYNIMITARDLGGNIHVEGPHNIYLDPNSDLPVCGITNPYPEMRVVGNLNIVGTCVDDDAVSYIELVFDGDDDHPIRADGKEFWSYYLDTLNLEEGPHTIKVTGYDINGLPGKPVSLRWQLDRNQPVTAITELQREENPPMGKLVSGTVTFDGVVSDGNGIKDLFYSIDGGAHFYPLKLSKSKDSAKFSVKIETKKFEDGPEVLWFKATDMSGSTGYYSFLYFIDNTKPDVQIISPEDGDVMNGKFSVAGFAKDKIGITSLWWDFGEQNGIIDLVPGNPYWSVNVDTIGLKEKARKFTIHAIDRVGNQVDVTRNIPLNQEDDKPVVTIEEPLPAQIFGANEDLFVRGFVTDDDSVQSVKIQLDSNEPVIQETKGDFYYNLCSSNELSAGKHKVVVTGIDENGIEGNPVTVEIDAKGLVPQFTEPKVTINKENLTFINGMEIHPESGAVFSVNVTSGIGIKSVHTELRCGKGVVAENDYELKNPTSYVASVPFNTDSPKGIVTFHVRATDTVDCVAEYDAIIYVTNTSVVKVDEPVIVFDDSTIGEGGVIINNPDNPASGYFIGGKAKSVEIIPETPFATAKLNGNQIRLIPGKEIGSSDPVVVKVTTDKGKEIISDPLIFKADTAFPVIKLNKVSDSVAIDGRINKKITVSGTVSCKTGIKEVRYRDLVARASIQKAVISTFAAEPIEEMQYTKINVDEDGKFSFEIESEWIYFGVHVFEIVAESLGGNISTAAVAVDTIPEIEEVNGKMPTAKAPAIVWLDGYDVYAVAGYQGTLDRNFQIFRRAEMMEGNNPVSMTVTTSDGKATTSKFTAVKQPTLTAKIDTVDGMAYLSGIPVKIPYGVNKEPPKMIVSIDTGANVSSVTYQFTGNEVAGGDNVQNGTAKLIKPADGSQKWAAEIPISNLPARVNKVAITIKAGTLEQTINGSITVIRANESSVIDDAENIYGFPAIDTKFDKAMNSYILADGSVYYYYANYNTPIKAEVICNQPGLAVKTDGKLVTLYATSDGAYTDAVIRITDRFGDIYETSPANFYADSKAPELHLETPVLHQWVDGYLKLSGTATDTMGIKKVEYSFNNGLSWKPFELTSGDNGNIGVTFSVEENITSRSDGLIKIDIRAEDNAGHTAVITTSCFKDTTPPVVTVVEPLDIDVVNGQNLIVFKVKENGFLKKVEYMTPPPVVETDENGNPVNPNAEVPEQEKFEIPLNPLVSTFVGTDKMPINEKMSFIFTDDAGNATAIQGWKFKIDSQSDLPVSEIHVPEEMQVITRDFTISGVVYDDDGDVTMFWKIDDGEFQKIPEKGTSFSIDIPLSTMTDNEHTVSIYAVDQNGVVGETVSRTFRISLEEPKGAVEQPTIDTSVRERVRISGNASDKNGIALVQVSLDNGNSYNDAVGTEEWVYDVDTRAIPGGTQVVFLKITDNYGIQGLYSSLINIDNDAPEVNLELPLDDSITSGSLFFSGYTLDNVGITELYVTIRNLENMGSAPSVHNIKIDRIIGEVIDMTNLEDGFYNVELTGKDKAGNTTNVSRNIHLDKARPQATIDVLYPLNGEHSNGMFSIYGQAAAENEIRSLKLYIDDKFVEETELSDCGFFKFEMSPENISDGPHTYHVDALLSTGNTVSSLEQRITYSSLGPWIKVTNFDYGAFATNRPMIEGTAGYAILQEEIDAAKEKGAEPELKTIVAGKKVARVELSFDNGKTFQELSTNGKWKYRVENQDIPEGYHFMMVRAVMVNGEIAVTRLLIQVDNSRPNVRLIAPQIGGRYNQKLNVSGLSNDDVKLEDVTVTLRKGDKDSYELPGFIQGLYLDFHMLGATFFDVGAGLTFFDDVVKIQVAYGQFTQPERDIVSKAFGKALTDMRYGGDMVLTGKIIANIYDLPFNAFLGHDFDWLSASFGLGAQFSRFNETNSGEPQILSAVLAQIEFPKMKFAKMKAFSALSFYTEGSLWFIPTDVKSTVDIDNLIPQIAFGVRVNIF